jgi:predicted ABC-type ATPase
MGLLPTAAARLESNPFDYEGLRDQIVEAVECVACEGGDCLIHAYSPDEARNPAGPGGGRWTRGMPEQGELFEEYKKSQTDRVNDVLKRAASDKRMAQAAAESAARGDARNGVLDSSGKYTLAADTMNERVAQSFLNYRAKVPADQQPTAVFMIGKPGAGKSAMITALKGKLPPMVNVNADDVQAKLPGYKGALAGNYHEWGCDVARHYLTPDAFKGHYNISFDMTDNSDRLERTLIEAKLLGYHTILLHADVDTATSVERAYDRFGTKGRLVDLNVVKSYGDRPKEAYEHAKSQSDLVDEWREYDTTDEGLGHHRAGREPRAILLESGHRESEGSGRPLLIGAERSLGRSDSRGSARRTPRDRIREIQSQVGMLQIADEFGLLGYSPDEERLGRRSMELRL